MRKFVLGLALLLAVSAAAFANTPADEDVTFRNWSAVYDFSRTATLIGNDLNGVDITANPSATIDAYITADVTGWLYNTNDELYFLTKGFEDNINVRVPAGVVPNWDDVTLFLQIEGRSTTSNNNYLVTYTVPWTGDGVFALGVDDITAMYVNGTQKNFSDELNASAIDFRLLNIGGSFVGLNLSDKKMTTGFFDLPEPSTYAYGIMGLASLLGLRRRIRK